METVKSLLNPEVLRKFKKEGAILNDTAMCFMEIFGSSAKRLGHFKAYLLKCGEYNELLWKHVEDFNMLYAVSPLYAHFVLALYVRAIGNPKNKAYEISFLRVDLFRREEMERLFRHVDIFNGWANILNSFYNMFSSDVVNNSILMYVKKYHDSTGLELRVEIINALTFLKWDTWFVWLYVARLMEESFKATGATMTLWEPIHYETIRDNIIAISALSELCD